MTDQAKSADKVLHESMEMNDSVAAEGFKQIREGRYRRVTSFDARIAALESALAEQRERAEAAEAKVKRQMVWATAGLHGKAEDDRINADKLVAINDMVNGLEEKAADRDNLLAIAKGLEGQLSQMLEAHGIKSRSCEEILAAFNAYLEGSEGSHD